jgi:pyroglutamyl-peptidase
MPTVLLTTFDAYGDWPANASWLCLVELTRALPEQPAVTTRRYPVDFTEARARLERDLRAGYDYAIHLGQAPGSHALRLEAFAINAGGEAGAPPDDARPLEPAGPAAYRSPLPLAAWAAKLRAAGVPAQVSHHAGTYLCNATLYWSCHLSRELGFPTRSAFVHLPLDTSQVLAAGCAGPSLPAALSAIGVRLILEELANDPAFGAGLPTPPIG